MKAIFYVYVISSVSGRRVFYHSYSSKQTAIKKARQIADRCVVVKRLPFGADLAEYEVS